MSGQSDKVAGKVKELSGKVTGDKDLEAEGKTQRLVGKVEQAGEDARGLGPRRGPRPQENGPRRQDESTSSEGEEVIILGAILLIIGFVAAIPVLGTATGRSPLRSASQRAR
jgi:uncharacterized protein YjbJ (UPF0337 family)